MGSSWGEHGMYLEVINKGVGPAIVKNVIVRTKGIERESVNEVLDQVLDSLDYKYGYSTINNRVLASNETLKAFVIFDKVSSRFCSKRASDAGV